MGKIFKNKRYFLIIIAIFALFFLFKLSGGGADSCKETNIRGWGWSDNLGWVSFSCMNCATDPKPEGCPEGNIPDYGVNINTKEGEEEWGLSGYAWSDNIGWINFNPSGPYPEEPHNSAQFNSITGKITGWAKALSNEEWILIGPIVIGETDYGVKLEGNELLGWAWGDKTLGWVSFSCKNQNECIQGDYKVWTTLRQDPLVLTRAAIKTKTEDGTSATLVGDLISLGGFPEADVWFEWGDWIEDECNLTQDTKPSEKMEATGTFTKGITFEESHGKTYCFRAIGENEKGISEGGILKFTVAKAEGLIRIILDEKEGKSIIIGEEGVIEIEKGVIDFRE